MSCSKRESYIHPSLVQLIHIEQVGALIDLYVEANPGSDTNLSQVKNWYDQRNLPRNLQDAWCFVDTISEKSHSWDLFQPDGMHYLIISPTKLGPTKASSLRYWLVAVRYQKSGDFFSGFVSEDELRDLRRGLVLPLTEAHRVRGYQLDFSPELGVTNQDGTNPRTAAVRRCLW
jgi:hypothetical protein